MRLILALLALASPALALTFPTGTRLTCRLDGTPTGHHIEFLGPGVYADQRGSPGGYIWDHRGFDFISGPFAGIQAEARPGAIRLSPHEGGRTLVCSP